LTPFLLTVTGSSEPAGIRPANAECSDVWAGSLLPTLVLLLVAVLTLECEGSSIVKLMFCLCFCSKETRIFG